MFTIPDKTPAPKTGDAVFYIGEGAGPLRKSFFGTISRYNGDTLAVRMHAKDDKHIETPREIFVQIPGMPDVALMTDTVLIPIGQFQRNFIHEPRDK